MADWLVITRYVLQEQEQFYVGAGEGQAPQTWALPPAQIFAYSSIMQ